jgi:hypothetical protein
VRRNGQDILKLNRTKLEPSAIYVQRFFKTLGELLIKKVIIFSFRGTGKMRRWGRFCGEYKKIERNESKAQSCSHYSYGRKTS